MRHVHSTTAQLWFASFALLALFPAVASANGTTLMPGGAASVSRGGATAARPEDPTAIATNPAGLAMLPGNQILFNLDTPFQRMCVDPYGYYGWGINSASEGTSEFGDQLALGDPPRIGGSYATTPLGPVCNSAGTFPLPNIAWAGRISKNFALGAGLLAPVLVPGMQFGGEDGTVQTPYGSLPTPTRYSMIKQEVIYASAPTFSAAYRFIPELSAGLSVQLLGVAASATQVQNPTGSTKPSTDFLGKVTTQDLFIPVLTFSVHAKPIRALNLMAAFKWSDDFRGTGDAVFETNTYYRGRGLDKVPYKNDPFRLSQVEVHLPWELTTGARFAGLLPGDKEGDPMDTERWDVEADFVYTFNKRAGANSASLGQDVELVTQTATGKKGSSTIKATDVGSVNVDQHLKNAYAIRLGGSFSVLPKRFAVNAGAFYESRGIELAYADITSFAFQRVGMGIGMMFRFGSWDLRLGAAHVLSETVEVAPPPHQPDTAAVPGDPRSGFDKRVGGSFNEVGDRRGGVVLEDPSAPSPDKADAVAAKTEGTSGALARPNRVINAGRYTASFDILSVGVSYHF
jgi:hypothetical protein